MPPPQFELPRSDPYASCPHTSHGCLCTIVHHLFSQQARPYFTLNQCLLRVFPFIGSPPLKFFLSLLSFFYLCHFSFSPSLCVVITISSPFYFTSFSCLSLPSEKEMAFWSSILAWKIPWTEEPGGIQSIESQRIGHDLATKPPPPFCVYFLPCLLELILHRYT